MTRTPDGALARLCRRATAHRFRVGLEYRGNQRLHRGAPGATVTYTLRVVALDQARAVVAEQDGPDLEALALRLERELTDQGLLT